MSPSRSPESHAATSFSVLTAAAEIGNLAAMKRILPFRRRMRTLALASLLVSMSGFHVAEAVDNWPSFRGPGGQGIVDDGSELPTEWGEDKNVAWKIAIDGKAWSTPVIWGDQLWVTNANEGGSNLTAHCFDTNTGKQVRKIKLRSVPAPQYCHPFNSYASPSPVIEEGRVYMTFGAPWTGCVDTDSGEILWERTDLKCNHFRGAGSSPFIHGDLLYLHFRRQRFSVHRRAEQEHWRDRVENRSQHRLSRHRCQWCHRARGRLAQSLLDATHRHHR